MGLASSLVSLGDGTLPASFEGLKSHIDAGWIQSALAAHGTATVRKRKLPAEQVIWLAVGMALYRDRPIPEVVRRLDLVLPDSNGNRRTVSNGAILPARDKVGADPLKDVFRSTAEHWGLESLTRYRWRGLSVLGLDGTSLRVPDTPENRKEFHLPGSKRRTSAYPQIRVVGLMVLRSRMLLDFAFAGFQTGEMAIAEPLLKRLPEKSLTVLDSRYINYGLLNKISSREGGRHWLVRGKSNLKWKTMRRLGRSDELVEIKVPYRARQNHPELPRTLQVRAIRYRRKGFRARVLLTSMLDAEQYPASEVADLYHERWELELGYDEIKNDVLERLETIRSKTPERVGQEVWGMAIAYNLVRREMEAAALSWGITPRRVSFRGSLMAIRDLFMWAAVASPGSLPKMVNKLRMDMRHLILPERRSERRYRRHVKIKMSRYPRNVGHPA